MDEPPVIINAARVLLGLTLLKDKVIYHIAEQNMAYMLLGATAKAQD